MKQETQGTTGEVLDGSGSGSPCNSGLDLSALSFHHHPSDKQGVTELLVLAPERVTPARLCKRSDGDKQPVQGQSQCPGEEGWGESQGKLSKQTLAFQQYLFKCTTENYPRFWSPHAVQLLDRHSKQPRSDLTSVSTSAVRPSTTLRRSQGLFPLLPNQCTHHR